MPHRVTAVDMRRALPEFSDASFYALVSSPANIGAIRTLTLLRSERIEATAEIADELEDHAEVLRQQASRESMILRRWGYQVRLRALESLLKRRFSTARRLNSQASALRRQADELILGVEARHELAVVCDREAKSLRR